MYRRSKPILFFYCCWKLNEHSLFSLRIRSRQHVSVFLWKRIFFFLLFGLLSKTLSRVEIFENACFSFTCVRKKMEVFLIRWCHISSATSITRALCGMLSYFHRLTFLCGLKKTIRIRYEWTRIFWTTEGKNSPSSKISEYVCKGPKIVKISCLFFC